MRTAGVPRSVCSSTSTADSSNAVRSITTVAHVTRSHRRAAGRIVRTATSVPCIQSSSAAAPKVRSARTPSPACSAVSSSAASRSPSSTHMHSRNSAATPSPNSARTPSRSSRHAALPPRSSARSLLRSSSARSPHRFSSSAATRRRSSHAVSHRRRSAAPPLPRSVRLRPRAATADKAAATAGADRRGLPRHQLHHPNGRASPRGCSRFSAPAFWARAQRWRSKQRLNG